MKKNYRIIYDKLRPYGARVLDSEEFALALEQPHHFTTSLGEHILLVADKSLDICRTLEGHGIPVDLQAVVVAALCHDLGMVGRDKKFANNRECCHQHPIDSVEIAARLIPELDEKTKKIIWRHMWPLSLHPPTSREEWVVMTADKYVSMRELILHRRKDRTEGAAPAHRENRLERAGTGPEQARARECAPAHRENQLERAGTGPEQARVKKCAPAQKYCAGEVGAKQENKVETEYGKSDN